MLSSLFSELDYFFSYPICVFCLCNFITFHFVVWFCNLCVKVLKQESFLYNRCNYSDPHFLIAITSDPFVSGSGVRSTTGLYPFLFCATGKSHRQAELDWYDQHGSIYLPSWKTDQLLWHWTDVTELLSIFKSRQSSSDRTHSSTKGGKVSVRFAFGNVLQHWPTINHSPPDCCQQSNFLSKCRLHQLQQKYTWANILQKKMSLKTISTLEKAIENMFTIEKKYVR